MYRMLMVVLLAMAPVYCSAADRPQLWLYYAINLSVDKNIEETEQLWGRAAKAGYTHVMLVDSKMAKLGDLGDATPRYFKNIERIKKIAADDHLTIVPALFNIGYSNNMLWHDPNLAEGLPVKDQPFIVHGGQAVPAREPAVSLGAKVTYKDEVVKIEQGVATVQDNPANARFSYALKVPKYRCYRVSVQIKTDHFTADPKIAVIDASGTKRTLQWQNLGVKLTQDWKLHQVIFNSLDSDAVTLYFGVWSPAKGALQWKDWKIEEVGLLNVLRRPGTPCVVKIAEGAELAEGKDYGPIVDPLLGNKPWKGEYGVTHDAPAIKVLDSAKLPDGTRLLVTWYHPAIIYDGQVSACISEPKVNELLADEAKRVKAAWGAGGYMMEHDEFRCCNWDAACLSHSQTPGQLLADNARFCTKLLEGAETYIWNDMFDPFHNAVKGPYYLVNGPWPDSWEGLDKRVIIVNWNFGHRDDSLKFFADRGHRQLIAGYYDAPVGPKTKAWLESAAKVNGVVGMMYTTWKRNYTEMEAFAKACGGNK